MFKKYSWVLLVLSFRQAYAEFNTESLVLQDAPCQFDLVSFKAESNLKFCNDLDTAFKQAVIDNKSILVIVVGGNGCPWSEKMLFDVVYKPEFYQEAQKSFVLCKLEIENLKSKGKEIGLDHTLEQIPLILCMSKEGKIIAEKSDIPESPQEVICYLNDVMQATSKISKVLAVEHTFADEQLEENYKLAKHLGLKVEQVLYAMGLGKKKNLFFMLEKYQKLLTAGSHKELKDLKLDIQRLDPRNTKGSIRSMAILDFEERSRQKKGMENPFSALKPLFEYLRDYGHYDKECRWEIEMRIARFLFAKNQIQAALQHAIRSLEWAPESRKNEVSEAVEFLKNQKDHKPLHP
jgi:thioredoxin-related protein